MKFKVLKCDRHGQTCLAVEFGNGTGRRLTDGKCCGQWSSTVETFEVSDDEVMNLASAVSRRIAEKMTGGDS